jgi:glucose/arabinose dehydrogenase
MSILTQTALHLWTRKLSAFGMPLLLVWLLLRVGQVSAEPQAPLLVPAGFSDTAVTNVSQPTALAFTPDGRMLVTGQDGRLRVYLNGVLTTALDLRIGDKVCNNFERGLLGVAVDPNFTVTQYIYLYYTANLSNTTNGGDCSGAPAGNQVNRVSRFLLPSHNFVLSTTEVILIDNIPSPNGNHNGGDLHFDADGLLYASTGDGGANMNNSQDLSNLAGKILRIDATGAIPAANPYANASGARRCGDPAGIPGGVGPCQEILAHGLRNPFRFVFQPGTNQFHINDVGAGTWEEISIGQSGANYGWPLREGFCARNSATNCGPQPVTMTNPLHAYHHNTGCASITGGAFVPTNLWPSQYEGAYLFADYVCGRIYALTTTNNVVYTSSFGTNLGGVTTMRFGPHLNTQALYYTTYGNGGQVRRIVYVANANRPPIAVASASPSFGLNAPLTVSFSALGSVDPDNDPITYTWNFGDGASLNNTTSVTVTHVYTALGIYTATLTARDAFTTSAPALARIDVGNSPPTPTIVAPLTSTRFAVGQLITLTGSAFDLQEGIITNTLSWNVILHHIDQFNPGSAHTHPFLSAVAGNNVVFTAPPPEDLNATALSYLEVQLTAIDSWGLARTITQTLQPNRVPVRFNTQPPTMTLSVNNIAISNTRTLTSWVGYNLNVNAPLQLDNQGQSWILSAWSDGGNAEHTITTPDAPITYTATFTRALNVWLPLLMR